MFRKSYSMFAFGLLALAAALLFSGDAFAAVTAHIAPATDNLMSLMYHATPALLAMRSEHAELVTRAAAKMAELKDGMPADVAARIEAEHTELVRKRDEVAARIAEAERAAPAVTPAATPPAAPPDVVAAERARAAEITMLGTRAGMPAEAVESALRDGASVEVFRARAFDHMATQADRTRTAPGAQILRDETDTRLRQLADALTVRIGGAHALRNEVTGEVRAMVGGASEFSRHSLAEMAAVVLNERHMPRDAAQREETLRRAMHTTSDFPVIFESSVNRVLAARYAIQNPTYRAISARRNFRDFRPHDQVRVGDFPSLQPVGEGGEIKFGTFGDSKETVAVAPYAIQFALSRRMLIDDNIGAIDQVLSGQGDSVAMFENVTFYAMKAANAGGGPTLREGNAAVFHANHSNLAQTPSVIDTVNLGKARAAMRKQKNASGNAINVSAKIILVGPDKETEAEMAVASVTPTKAADYNPFSGKLQVVAEGLIAGNAWELYADPAVAPVFVWGMLDGYNAPRLRIENPFGVQGVGISLEHDFGCGAIDFRGAHRNAGA